MPGLASLLALAALAAPQSPSLVDIAIQDYDQVPGLPDGWYARFWWNRFHTGADGGWVLPISATFDNPPPLAPSVQAMIIGRHATSPVDSVEILQASGPFQGSLFAPSMAAGSIAYITSGASGAPSSVYRDDQLIVSEGDLIPGSQGKVWSVFHRAELTTSGDVLIHGSAEDPLAALGQAIRTMIWRWPSGEILLDLANPLTGLAPPLVSTGSSFAVSPDGSHWSVAVSQPAPGDWAIVVDGSILDLGGGHRLMRGEPVPASIAGSSAGAGTVWQSFGDDRLAVNDDGDYAFGGTFRVGVTGEEGVLVRNGRRIGSLAADTYSVGIDARGALLTATTSLPFALTLEGADVLRAPLGVDADGDGVEDPGYQVRRPDRGSVGSPGRKNETVYLTRARRPGGLFQDSIVIARPSRTDLATCDGVSNSSGHPAQLVVVGSAELVDNEVSLRLLGLPENAAGYMLISRLDGFVPQAGGSQGNLCLGGAIGRMTDQVFAAGGEGRADVALDLTNIPQPTGPVAAMAGIRWFAQAWYRDAVAGTATSNFSSASVMTFR